MNKDSGIDLKGMTIGNFRVIYKGNINKDGYRTWLTLCVCGKRSYTSGYFLTSGLKTSCGCIKKERKHKYNISQRPEKINILKDTRLDSVWRSMINRCNNEKSKAYKWYGKRGISICKEWMSFENFRKMVTR